MGKVCSWERGHPAPRGTTATLPSAYTRKKLLDGGPEWEKGKQKESDFYRKDEEIGLKDLSGEEAQTGRGKYDSGSHRWRKKFAGRFAKTKKQHQQKQ